MTGFQSKAGFQSKEVAETFATYPPKIRRKLLALRKLILETARRTEGVGAIDECLKWGEPAYLTSSGSGSTIRLAWSAKRPRQFGLYFNCQTDLVETFRRLFAGDFTFEGNRAIVFDENAEPPSDKLMTCIAMALTYHRRKKLN